VNLVLFEPGAAVDVRPAPHRQHRQRGLDRVARGRGGRR
jgi:hypothetical protein